MAKKQNAGSQRIESAIEAVGKVEGDVHVRVSYDIIQQLSKQLYTNPRKAIEELVCNSYDAGASECHVKVPVAQDGALLVLDNGESMDFQGLQGLWMVAQSPKVARTGPRIANGRLQIGKFGVGKLAAYALGRRLTHIATTKGITRVVSVDQGNLKGNTATSAPKFKVYRAPEKNVRALLEPMLGDLPRPWNRGWAHWTIALVEDIFSQNFDQALKLGLLRKMISTALPIGKVFQVRLDGELIEAQKILPNEIEIEVNVLDQEFRDKLEAHLKSYWAERGKTEEEDVPAERYRLKLIDMVDPQATSKKIKAISVPEVGPVSGTAILAYNTLTPKKQEERGYASHGFHISSHSKLINPEDELFGIEPRSHAYWRRFLARVEMPGLDDVLLVQRNAVSENDVKAQVAREVMRSLFNFTRSRAEKEAEKPEGHPRSFGTKLRTAAPLLLPLAIHGLTGGKAPVGGVESIDIEFASFGESVTGSRYEASTNRIQINDEHPIMVALDELPEAEQRQWRQVVGELLAACKLVEGLQRAKKVPEDLINDIGELFDLSIRAAASYIRDPVEQHIDEIRNTSYEGATPFERAVVNALRSLRLVAHHIGGADLPDGIVEIPVAGKENLRIAIEAKGSNGVITHQDLSRSTVERHEKESQCTSSIAIAREYATKGIAGKKSALFRETENILPLLTVNAMAKMLRLHRQRPFTYDKVAKIFTTWKSPDELPAFIEEQWREVPRQRLMKLVLEVAHDQLTEDNHNFPDPGMLVGDPRLRKVGIDKDTVRHILNAVAVTTGLIVIRDQKTFEFDMKAPVDTILQAMTGAAEETAPIEPIENSGSSKDDD
jgi:hypothetical protein